MRSFSRLWFSLVAVAVVAAAIVIGVGIGTRERAQAQSPADFIFGEIDFTIESPDGYSPKWGFGQVGSITESHMKLAPGQTVEDVSVGGYISTIWVYVWFGQAPHSPPAGWSEPQFTCESSADRDVLVQSAPDRYSDDWRFVSGQGWLPAGPEIVPGWRVSVQDGEHITCTVTAERLMRPLVIEKQFTNPPDWRPLSADDVPTLSGLPEQAELVSGGFSGNVYRWEYSVPLDWSGTITEIPKPGWFPENGVATCEVEAPDADKPVEQVELRIETQQAADCIFVNEWGRELYLVKAYWTLMGAPSAADVPTFNLPAGSAIYPWDAVFKHEWYTYGQSWLAVLPPDWTGPITENTPSSWNGVTVSCVVEPSTTQCTFRNSQSGTVRVEKWEDVNRNGVLDVNDVPIPNSEFRLHGIDQDGNWQQMVDVVGIDGTHETHNLIAGWESAYEDIVPSGWEFVASSVDGIWNSSMYRETLSPNGRAMVVQFLSRRAPVEITVSKTIYNNANPAGANGGAGWQFTLSGCGVGPLQGTTGATGTVTWSDLPPAIDCAYTITETSRAGWIADTITRTVAPFEGGSSVTVTFVNRQFEGCTNIANCGPVTTSSSPTPTPTATTPTPVDPTPPPTDTTPAPAEPTETPFVPEETVAGETTAGRGANATPIAPSTGASSTRTPASLSLLAILGTIFLAAGVTTLLAARRR